MGDSYDGPDRRRSESKLDRIAEDCAATRAHVQNLKEHIIAVGMNVRDVQNDLLEHRESIDAHGRKAADGALSQVAAWFGLALAAVAAAFEIRRQ